MSTYADRFEGIGTHWEIDIHVDLPASAAGQLLRNARTLVEEFDQQYSRFITTSLVWQIRNNPGRVTVPEEFVELLLFYIPLYKLSHGQFTPLIGSLLEEAGYDDTYSLKTSEMHDVPEFLSTVTIQDARTITVSRPVLIDIGAIGKGYLVDKVALFLKHNGASMVTVNAGGDIMHYGDTPITVGLENPDDPGTVIGSISLQNQAICSSAGNRRKWQQYHHIMSPIEKASPTHLKATWVVAGSATIADALSTALFFITPDSLQRQYSFEYLLLSPENKVKGSFFFRDNLFRK
jgi:thiamine biosynthesis lipoprotein